MMIVVAYMWFRSSCIWIDHGYQDVWCVHLERQTWQACQNQPSWVVADQVPWHEDTRYSLHIHSIVECRCHSCLNRIGKSAIAWDEQHGITGQLYPFFNTIGMLPWQPCTLHSPCQDWLMVNSIVCLSFLLYSWHGPKGIESSKRQSNSAYAIIGTRLVCPMLFYAYVPSSSTLHLKQYKLLLAKVK